MTHPTSNQRLSPSQRANCDATDIQNAVTRITSAMYALEQENERLRAALEEAACVLDSEAPVAAQRARKALSGNSSAPETTVDPTKWPMPPEPKTWMPQWLREFHCQCESSGEGAGKCVACQAANLIAGSSQETSRNAVPWNPETSSAVPIHQQSPQKATRDPPGSYRDATGELVLPQVPARCINYPCQLRAGHTGPCDSFPNGPAESP